MPPKQVINDKYIIYEILGQGAFGTVFKAFNSETGQTVALKQINMKNSIIPTSELNEISLLQQLRGHENILNYLDHFIHENSLYIATEFIETGSLQQIIKKFGILSDDFALKCMHQTLRGLSFLHSQNILHRDIKAANLLIDKNGTIKIADFGVSETLQQAQDLEVMAGTPYWMAKEVILMEACTDKSDIWSLGATLLELITGSPPFFDLEPAAACYKIATVPVPIPSDINPIIRSFLTKCFADYNVRLSADQLLKEFFDEKQVEEVVILEQFSDDENDGFSSDEEEINTMKLQPNQLVFESLEQGKFNCEVEINDELLKEIITNSKFQLILYSLSKSVDISIFRFFVNLLNFAQSRGKVLLVLRKFSHAGFGLVHSLLCMVNQIDKSTELVQLLIKFLELIDNQENMFLILIFSSFCRFLNQIFQYSKEISQIIINLIYKFFNLNQSKPQISNNKYQISQYLKDSEILKSLLVYLLHISSKYNLKTCPHNENTNINEILIFSKKIYLIFNIVSTYFKDFLEITHFCFLHAIYVNCKQINCKFFVNDILKSNLNLIQRIYSGNQQMQESDMLILLNSAKACKEAEQLCSQLIINRPILLHSNLQFLTVFRDELKTCQVLAQIKPEDPKFNEIILLLGQMIQQIMIQNLENRPIEVMKLFSQCSQLVQGKKISFEQKILKEKLFSENTLDMLGLVGINMNSGEAELKELAKAVNSSIELAVNILNDFTLFLGILRAMERSGSKLGIYLEIIQGVKKQAGNKLNPSYLLPQRLQRVRGSCGEVLQRKIDDILTD